MAQIWPSRYSLLHSDARSISRYCSGVKKGIACANMVQFKSKTSGPQMDTARLRGPLVDRHAPLHVVKSFALGAQTSRAQRKNKQRTHYYFRRTIGTHALTNSRALPRNSS